MGDAGESNLFKLSQNSFKCSTIVLEFKYFLFVALQISAVTSDALFSTGKKRKMKSVLGQDSFFGCLHELANEQCGFSKSSEEQIWWLVVSSKTNKLNKLRKNRKKKFSLSSFFVFLLFPLEISKALGASKAGKSNPRPTQKEIDTWLMCLNYSPSQSVPLV